MHTPRILIEFDSVGAARVHLLIGSYTNQHSDTDSRFDSHLRNMDTRVEMIKMIADLQSVNQSAEQCRSG